MLESSLGEYRAAHVEFRDQLILEVWKEMDDEDEVAVEQVLAEDLDLYNVRPSCEKRCLHSEN